MRILRSTSTPLPPGCRQRQVHVEDNQFDSPGAHRIQCLGLIADSQRFKTGALKRQRQGHPHRIIIIYYQNHSANLIVFPLNRITFCIFFRYRH